MSVVKSLVIILAAVRICLYMRCFFTCIGKYRVSKKIVAAVFAVLWIFEGFLISISYIGRGIAPLELFFLLAEILFISAVSFCYQGRAAGRLLMAFILPTVYWIGKWSVVSVLFAAVTDSRQYFIATSISVGLFFVFGLILEKAGKSRQERERELLEQEVRIYENQFGIIRQSQHNIRALKHDIVVKKVSPAWGLGICFLLFILCKRIQYGCIGIGGGMQVPAIFYSIKILTPLGFPFPGFKSSDYFPMIPWMFLYLCGYFFNGIFMGHDTWKAAARHKVPVLSAIGSRTIWIYLLHQPVSMLVCSIVPSISRPTGQL